MKNMKHKTIPLKGYRKRLNNYKKAQHYLKQNAEAYTFLDQQINKLEAEISQLRKYNAKMRVWNHRKRRKK